MKHIFYIHSHICYQVALKLILHEKLNRKYCIFLTGRGFDIEPERSILFYPFPFSKIRRDYFPYSRRFWLGWKRLRELDDFIKMITQGDGFFFYTPQTSLKPFQLIISHKQCRGFNLIEEGLGSYHTLEEINGMFSPQKIDLKNYLLSCLNYKCRLSRKAYFYHPNYKKAYGISELTFPGFDRRVIVGLPDFPTIVDSSIEHILIFDSIVENNYTSAENLMRTLNMLLSYLIKRKVKVLHYKFHPVQLQFQSNVNSIRDYFDDHRNCISCIEVKPEVSPESIAYSTSANFYVFFSSAGFYATFYNCKVYTLANIVNELDPAFKWRFGRIPKLYRERMLTL